jgi:hypothetical protein
MGRALRLPPAPCLAGGLKYWLASPLNPRPNTAAHRHGKDQTGERHGGCQLCYPLDCEGGGEGYLRWGLRRS